MQLTDINKCAYLIRPLNLMIISFTATPKKLSNAKFIYKPIKRGGNSKNRKWTKNLIEIDAIAIPIMRLRH